MANRRLDEEEQAILERLERGPISLSLLVRESRYGTLVLRRVVQLVAERFVLRAGFTPTDALHVAGQLDLWNGEAAELSAQVLAGMARRTVQDLCQDVVLGVSSKAAEALVTKVLSDEKHRPHWQREPTARLLLDRALGDGHDGELFHTLTLRRPVVAIGAPVEAYMPRTAAKLNTRLIIPSHADVANAVGAVVGGVVQRQRVLIAPLDSDENLRLHLPEGVIDFQDLEAAVDYARKQMQTWMEALAQRAGATQVEVQMTRRDSRAQVGMGWGGELYLGSELVFTAVGRPSPTNRNGEA